MKNFKKIFTLFALITLVYSCSSESNEGGRENNALAVEQNALEDVAVPLSNLNSDISIVGATKKTGTPPQPNDNIDLQLETKEIEAYQNSGFNLKFFTSESDVAGAYILFKDLDGNVASDYFDIPVTSFLEGRSGSVKNIKSLNSNRDKNTKTNSARGGDGEFQINVDFGDAFPPGQFCADLCIYDSENNVGQIVTICVEVEAWGGNAAIIGEWTLESSTDDDIDTINCNNGQSIEVPYEEDIREEFLFVLESDGDFQLNNDEEYKSLDWQATTNNCVAIYSEEITKDESRETGKWAYNEVKNTLTLVSFKYEDFLEPEFNEDYPNGDLIFEGDDVKVVNDKLVITETYTEDGESFTEVYTFRRK